MLFSCDMQRPIKLRRSMLSRKKAILMLLRTWARLSSVCSYRVSISPEVGGVVATMRPSSPRNKMRVKFNLFGSPCNDCLVHSFCESCALCQEYRELKHLGFRPLLGWKGNLRRQERKMRASMAAPVSPTMEK